MKKKEWRIFTVSHKTKKKKILGLKKAGQYLNKTTHMYRAKLSYETH